MRPTLPDIVLLTLAVCFLCTAPAAVGQAGEVAPKRVVLLNSADPYLPAYVALDGALRAAVSENSDGPVEFFAETLDMHRFPRQELEDSAFALLQKKYRALEVDVVVAFATTALEFALHHRDDIWPGAALVFLSVTDPEQSAFDAGDTAVGVPASMDFDKAVDLALRLRPNTRLIAVVAGAAGVDQWHLSKARTALEQLPGGIEVRYIAGLPMADTLAAVRALPADAIILYTTTFRDGDGIPQVPAKVLEQVYAASTVPIFGIYETYLGRGMLAGQISSYASQGRRAGDIVARILVGDTSAAHGNVAPVEPTCMVDAHQLDHWGITQDSLPIDCEIRFREPTTWERYHWQIAFALAIFLAQTALILLLALNRRRLARATSQLQNEYAQREEVEKNTALLEQRLTRFSRERSLGAMVTTIAHEIAQPLIAIQNYAQAAKRRSASDEDDKTKLVELLGKIETQAARAGDITHRVRALVNNKEVQMRPCSLFALVEESITMVQARADNPPGRIVYHPADRLPPVMADALQIQLVLVNLLSNALNSLARTGKEDGIVAIDATLSDDHTVCVSVTDEGTGIEPDRAQYIFEPLYSDTQTGMGVGLAICQEIISGHGGCIWYEPNPAGGAIFRFTLRTVEP
ncbi:MAG: sensor histidine kinase [Pseudomonadales bacterium]|nr:sensor histidine kinase [Pseudomonadales bacterium]